MDVLTSVTASTTKSAVSAVGMTAVNAVGERTTKEEGGFVWGSFFLNRTIPCNICPANCDEGPEVSKPANRNTEPRPRDTSL
ncbi:MAG: hypothetical protein FJ118_01795 [Deltaproteobacteria bacterium]|nr:hypothetical protein [Deltaproteobacteria bacterium]